MKTGTRVTEDIHERVVAFIPRLRRFAFSLTGDWDRMDELVQDTCERALTRQDQWTPGTSLESWMCRIAQNLWKDGLKSKKNRTQVSDESLHFLTGVDGRREMEDRLTLKAVMVAISKLPADQRLVLALVCIDGQTYAETAEILEIPIGTVMSRLARARQVLYDGLYESKCGAASTKVEG
jgi:RNA polymerase sigma-70 factor (ECF subfamily)